MYMCMCPRQVPPADMETGALAALTNKKYRVTRVGPLVYAGIQYMLTQWPGKNGKYASWLKVPSTLLEGTAPSARLVDASRRLKRSDATRSTASAVTQQLRSSRSPRELAVFSQDGDV